MDKIEVTDAPAMTIVYTNWRGETAERRIVPVRLWYGVTDWHPKPGWLLRAVDVEKAVERDFAWSGIAFQGELATARAQGHKAGMIEAAAIAQRIADGRSAQFKSAKVQRKGFEAHDYESMAMSAIEIAAAILAAAEEE